MADDLYRWVGKSSATVGAEYDVAANWLDLTTIDNVAVPGHADNIVFDAVPAATGLITLGTADAANSMSVKNGAGIDLLGVHSVSDQITAAETLDVQSLCVTGSSSLFTYGAVVNVAGKAVLNDGSLGGQPFAVGGVVIAGSTHVPHDEVYVGAGGTLRTSGHSFVSALDVDGRVIVGAGTLSFGSGEIFGGLRGTGIVDVLGTSEGGPGTLDLSAVDLYHGAYDLFGGTLHLEPGSAFNLGNTNLAFTGDFINGNAGVGNSYDPLAGVMAVHRQTGASIVVNGKTVNPTGGHLSGSGAKIALGGATLGSNGSYTLDLGSFHVGETVRAGYRIENTGSAGSAKLRGAIQTAVHGATISDSGLSGSGVTAQNFGPIAPGMSSDTYGVTLTADRSGTSRLAQLVLPTDFGDSGTVMLDITGTGYNYAAPVFERVGHDGKLTQHGTSWTLDLGTLAKGCSDGTAQVAVANAATGLADSLSGSFVVSGSGFSVSGANPFGKLANDGSRTAPVSITPDTTHAGKHSETILLAPTGSNPSGYSAALSTETLTVTDTVTAAPVFTFGTELPGGLQSLLGGLTPPPPASLVTQSGSLHSGGQSALGATFGIGPGLGAAQLLGHLFGDP